MIKIKDFEKVLRLNGVQGVLVCAEKDFVSALKSGSPSEFVKDFTSMSLTQDLVQSYYQQGLNVLTPVVNSKKHLI